jgi:uncharacterized protein (TIGR00369 family)
VDEQALEERIAARKVAFAQHPLHRTLGIELVEARPGFARLTMAASPLTMGGIGGSVHGGLLACLVDVALLEAMIPTLDPATDTPAGTADLNITYLRPTLGSRAIADATVLRKGRQLAVVEVEIKDDTGKLCAKGRTIYAIRPKA